MSAKHVLGIKPEADQEIRVVFYEPGKKRVKSAVLGTVRTARDIDLAVAKVPLPWSPTLPHYLSLADDGEVQPGEAVQASDWATRFNPQGPMPYLSVGHIYAVFIERRPVHFESSRPAWVVDVSLPLHKGMSGAPVLIGTRVAGVLVTNIYSELEGTPVGSAKEEHRRFFLPIGQAIHVAELRRFLTELGVLQASAHAKNSPAAHSPPPPTGTTSRRASRGR